MSDQNPTPKATKIYIPRDSTSLSLGAEEVAQTFHRYLIENNLNNSIELIRNGSRGLYWLEPLIEIENAQGRFAFGPVTEKDVVEIINNEVLHQNQNHPLYLGPTEDIPALKNQQRLTFARAGLIDPLNIADYEKTEGFLGLKKAIGLNGQEIVDTIKDSGLRGRGGAAFPTGIKWQTVLDAKTDQKYIVCNADEGDSGTFADRLQMEADPFGLIEGMIIAGFAVGATRGYIYLREEYPHAHEILKSAITIAKNNHYLGENILGSDKTFHLEVRLGAKAYICGEETALLESLEGKRGMVRPKPPIPALEGLFGKPTIVNNVLTLSTVSIILAKGSSFYKDYGQGRSLGTMPFQLAGNLKHCGLFEFAFGITLKELLFDYGGGSYTGKPLKAVQVGGPLGTYLSESQWQVEMDYEKLAALGGVLGHGGVVAFDDSVDMLEQARFAMEFCVEESCGKCTPCRIGSTRGVEVIDRIKSGEDKESNIELLEELCETMIEGSLCAMGGMTPFPVQSVLREFKDDVAN